MILSAPSVTSMNSDGSPRVPLLAALDLPAGTSTVELHTDGTPDLSRFRLLHEMERRLVARAVAARRSDFGDARWCAHEALRRWGRDEPILRGEKGMPLFPHGIVGTLSHTEGLRGALVGDAGVWRSVGLDVEKAQPLPAGVFNAVTSPSERWALSRLTGSGRCENLLGTVLFSAKESVYKSWFPLAGRFLDFDEAELHLEVGGGGSVGSGRVGGSWRARLLTSPTPVDEITGSWVIRDGYVATVCGIRR
ncbi:4'-phosphopantetheinyl transferase [uncultured Corynebacterium sp.]|uniref:4'-phosphopantetheinyl transferase family protein n=1 Tax=uncultured Corynebacterium sp. TaxID=159447 RepID=UPI0025D8F198|nr:4'-phosphopantetheinyl transferase superfamily protein [uncultured Corynebacterium sp.]